MPGFVCINCLGEHYYNSEGATKCWTECAACGYEHPSYLEYPNEPEQNQTKMKLTNSAIAKVIGAPTKEIEIVGTFLKKSPKKNINLLVQHGKNFFHVCAVEIDGEACPQVIDKKKARASFIEALPGNACPFDREAWDEYAANLPPKRKRRTKAEIEAARAEKEAGSTTPLDEALDDLL